MCLPKQFSSALHFYSCGNSIGWGQMASLWWIGSKGMLLVFWKTNQTRTQSCKKVSSMNSHSLNLSAPTLEQKCHSGGLCMFIVRSFVYILSTLTLSFEQFSSSLYYSMLFFSPLLHQLFLPECGGAHSGCCIITHEHHYQKWSSENDVNWWHLWKCQWVFMGAIKGERDHYGVSLLWQCI